MRYKVLLFVFLWFEIQGVFGFFPAGPSAISQYLFQVQPAPNQAPPGFSVRIHPDGGLFIGEQVSFEVFYSPAGGAAARPLNLTHQNIQAQVDAPNGPMLPAVPFRPDADPGSFLATFLWAWDTRSLPAGQHTLTYSLPQETISWSQSLDLQPAADLPPPEPGSHWASLQTTCCTLSYLTGTAAERDIHSLAQIANQQAQSVLNEFHTQLKSPILITFLPRVLGQGGFTTNEIEVSYLDRNYAGSTIDIILHHEMVHWVDGQLGGDLHPTLFVEGLAVYLSGGHFKPEPILLRAAALQEMGWYIPLTSLADQFYASQHEIGYLEGAAFINYIVDTYGWDAFNRFYRDIHPIRNQGQAASIDAALQAHFGLSFSALEGRFRAFLRSLDFPTDMIEDLSLTVRYYDAVRDYERVLDPSAYFRRVWLPDVSEMRKRGITADLLRHPYGVINRRIEQSLVQVDAALRAGDYPGGEAALTQVQRSLSSFALSDSVVFVQDRPMAWLRQGLSAGIQP
ncbi:MAG TPA: hypothetical protein VGJ97_01910 [Anaerolineaceae bacterium]